jgi:dolichyl-phosphate-mannose-protein mannosyltransferase
MRIRWDLVGLAVLLLLALVVRLGALAFDGHNGDVSVMMRWAEEKMAVVGPLRFYDVDNSIYPALLYPLWILATDLDGDALALAIKGLSIPFDLGIGVLLYVLIRGRSSERAALAGASLYLFNPAVLLAGPVWGQVDSAGTLAFLAALIASSRGRDGIAGALGLLAAFCKPQFGLVLLPVLAVAAIRSWRSGRIEAIARALGGVVVAWLVIGGPLLLHPLRYAGLLSATAGQQPETSLHAFNPWGLFVGFGIPDGPYVLIGSALLLIGVVGALVGLRRGDDLAILLAVGAVLVLAFYFLPTRVHERYLFPAMALLVPFAVATGGQFIAYLVLSAGFAASLLYALHDTTPFDLPAALAEVLVSPAGVWGIGLVMIGAAVAWAWLLLVRRPRLPEAGAVHPAS